MLGIKSCKNVKSTALAACLVSFTALLSDRPLAIANSEDGLLAQNQQPETFISVPSFYVTVMPTDHAQQRMESDNETIVVFATLMGEASSNASVRLDESGRVDLTSSQHELIGSGRTTEFSDLAIASDIVNQLASRDYTVNVNVVSGRQSSDDNLLACDVFEGRMSELQPGVTLRCGLIGEYDSQFLSTSNHSVLRGLSDH